MAKVDYIFFKADPRHISLAIVAILILCLIGVSYVAYTTTTQGYQCYLDPLKYLNERVNPQGGGCGLGLDGYECFGPG